MSSDDPPTPDHGPPGYDAHTADGTVTTAADPCGDQLVRIANGSTGAFEELFAAQSRILMAVILRIVKSRSLAEEVLQECFTEVWTRCSGFDSDRGTGRAWLITLCRRRAIDCVRSVQAQQDRDFADGLRASAGAGEQVEQTVIDKSESDRTVTALKILPEDQSRPIVMAFYQGLTHAEISESLRVPLGTIKTRIRDGMKKLREELEASR
ncbi:MAG: sigma-70 family RNA polymerase sigma factor [Brevibacterium sp.]|uniref:sigma-70 family RNA polymerase sigma factor n=1 Tax=Brevibacterium sp. TaxID=1701 RepID=UPI002648B9ED|nr:sigma-70 family RNA polymerase sigma factor [Brevibacterium sp.]MDN5807631.1 sigma-70 family RNA polymerase sigma factor [Brevibacterium sp.]MDN5834108.1 sigma-70 family RNA polymerase sigma factor [Brevibacterium sp.]MDN5876870.1 sigma-70 family RNA polymerase sigma factor [Brevibacterium sp.]MDN6158188.1 sigma-70 family RNA polymerase sigma factor [Brevibacterium sp.]MDN6189598.1 sigma-70 family RNA polymerase sigma factor [Brevibacterium sp.]